MGDGFGSTPNRAQARPSGLRCAKRSNRGPRMRPEIYPIEVLLVEDNPGDVRLTQEALREGKVRNHLSVVSDGVEALAYLRREGRYTQALRPDLILLDL